MAESVLEPVRHTFRALAQTIVPEASHLDEAGWAELEAVVEGALAERPAEIRRQLRLFIRVLQWGPLPRYARRFTSLDRARRTRFLEGIQNSRVMKIRQGFWGLRTLVFMGYYARPAAAAEVGYRADPRGWEARR